MLARCWAHTGMCPRFLHVLQIPTEVICFSHVFLAHKLIAFDPKSCCDGLLILQTAYRHPGSQTDKRRQNIWGWARRKSGTTPARDTGQLRFLRITLGPKAHRRLGLPSSQEHPPLSLPRQSFSDPRTYPPYSKVEVYQHHCALRQDCPPSNNRTFIHN